MDWTEPKMQTPTLCAITGTKTDQIRQWVLNGIYRPEKPAEGAGYPALHSLRGALTVSILSKLSRLGISLAVARDIAESYTGLMEVLDDDYVRSAGESFWVYVNFDGSKHTYKIKDTKKWTDVIGIDIVPIVKDIARQFKNLE